MFKCKLLYFAIAGRLGLECEDDFSSPMQVRFCSPLWHILDCLSRVSSLAGASKIHRVLSSMKKNVLLVAFYLKSTFCTVVFPGGDP